MTKIGSMLLALALIAPAASNAESIRVKSPVPVDEAVGNMKAAIEAAGVRIFAEVDYAKGSATVGNHLRPTTLIIFGSPKIGADALLTGQTMGLFLPLRVLVYEDRSGDVWLMYEDPMQAAREHGIPQDHPAVMNMVKALRKVTSRAAGGTKSN